MAGFGYINDPQTKTENGKVIDLMAKDYKFSDLQAKLGSTSSSGDVDLSQVGVKRKRVAPVSKHKPLQESGNVYCVTVQRSQKNPTFLRILD